MAYEVECYCPRCDTPPFVKNLPYPYTGRQKKMPYLCDICSHHGKSENNVDIYKTNITGKGWERGDSREI